MTIFDDIPRNDTNPPRQDEAAFPYLNRSGRTEAGRVRELVDRWFANYPDAHRASLIARFRSPIDDQHKSAFFELFLHELIVTRGHMVVEIEPALDHTRKSPDFLVQDASGQRFYLEAVLTTGRSQQEIAAQARLNQALTAIDKTPSPAHFLDLSVHGVPAAPVTIRNMKSALQAWIASLPSDKTASNVPPFVYEEHGMQITLRPFPRNNPGRTSRSIGVRHFPVQLVTVDDDIRAALEVKASRYGTLNHPYVVAVNALPLFQHEEDAFDALLGTPAVAIRHLPDGTIVDENIRNRDGVWMGPRGPRKQGLSAVLSTEQIDPWNFASRRSRLIRNPWASRPLPFVSLGVDELNPDGDRFRRTDGAVFGTIFGLPDHWPQE